MVYLGDNWPAKYRGQVFMNNIHGRRVNMMLTRKGSGYTASHAPDVMRAADPWFVGVSLAYGPDGGVYVSDFSDTGECHHTRNTRKHTGRIYKITYGKPKPWRGTSASSRPRSLPRCSCTTTTGSCVMPAACCMSGWITRTKSGAPPRLIRGKPRRLAVVP